MISRFCASSDAVTGGAVTSELIMEIARVHYLPFSAALYGKGNTITHVAIYSLLCSVVLCCVPL
jgi:hypothetical protein